MNDDNEVEEIIIKREEIKERINFHNVKHFKKAYNLIGYKDICKKL